MKRVLCGAVLVVASALLAWLWWQDREYRGTADWVIGGVVCAAFMSVWWFGYISSIIDDVTGRPKKHGDGVFSDWY